MSLVIAWSGLRGAVGLCMALVLAEDKLINHL